MSKVKVLNEEELTAVVGGKNGKNVDWVKCYVGGVASAVAGFATGGPVDWVKCYVGGVASAVAGFATGGPVGYWAGAGVGYATFCR